VQRGHPVVGSCDTHCLTVLWSTQAKLEVIVLQAAWHWDSDSSIINNPLGEPDHTALYVGLLSVWGSMDSDHIFPPISCESSLTRDPERQMKESSENGASLWELCKKNLEGSFFTRGPDGYVKEGCGDGHLSA
jgi:hypothetical protein